MKFAWRYLGFPGGLFALLLVSCGPADKAKPAHAETAPRLVRVGRVESRPMERTLPVVGTLAARDEATVSAQVAGQIEQNHVDFGDRVTAGQELVLGHGSPNFDRSGWLVDPNVVFPLDRLRELASEGRIGSVADRHITFAGNQPGETLATITLDSGPAAAALLREDGVDIVLLTPV